MPAHGLGPMWFAIPSSQGTFTPYSLPVSRRTCLCENRRAFLESGKRRIKQAVLHSQVDAQEEEPGASVGKESLSPPFSQFSHRLDPLRPSCTREADLRGLCCTAVSSHSSPRQCSADQCNIATTTLSAKERVFAIVVPCWILLAWFFVKMPRRVALPRTWRRCRWRRVARVGPSAGAQSEHAGPARRKRTRRQ